MNVKDYGAVLLRLLYPDDHELHFSLPDVGNPQFLELVAAMQRQHGVPLVTYPNPRFHRNYRFGFPTTGNGNGRKVIAFPKPVSREPAGPERSSSRLPALPRLPEGWKQ